MITRDHPDYDAVHARAFRWLKAKGCRLTVREIDEALRAGENALRNERVIAKLPDETPALCVTCGEITPAVGQRCARCTLSMEEDRHRREIGQ